MYNKKLIRLLQAILYKDIVTQYFRNQDCIWFRRQRKFWSLPFPLSLLFRNGHQEDLRSSSRKRGGVDFSTRKFLASNREGGTGVLRAPYWLNEWLTDLATLLTLWTVIDLSFCFDIFSLEEKPPPYNME
jgi:hypothetical protein